MNSAVQKLLGACLFGAASFAAASSAHADETLKIGYTAALSGAFAAYGENMQRGVELAIAQINGAGGIAGRPVELVVADDRGEPREGVLVAQRLCGDASIDVLTGYSFSSIALAAIPIIDRCKLPVVASAVTSPELSGSSAFFRRNILTDATQGQLAGAYVAEKFPGARIALLHQQDDYGIGATRAFREAATAGGAEIVAEEAYQLGVRDFRTQITLIRSVRPDIVWIGGFYAEAARIAQQSRQLGLSAQFFGSDGLLSPDLIAQGGAAVEGILLYGMFTPDLDDERVASFVEAYEARYGEQPSSWAALAYDAINSVAAAARDAAETEGEVTRASLQAALSRVDALPGVTGPTSFDEKGDRHGTVLFLQVKDGRFTAAP